MLHHGDLTDSSTLIRNMQQVQPDEVYNLAAKNRVAVLFEHTENLGSLGTLRIIESI